LEKDVPSYAIGLAEASVELGRSLQLIVTTNDQILVFRARDSADLVTLLSNARKESVARGATGFQNACAIQTPLPFNSFFGEKILQKSNFFLFHLFI
jgi:hypothetical protein